MEELSRHCDLDLEDRNPNFSHDTQVHDDARTYQVSFRKDKWFRRIYFFIVKQISPEDEEEADKKS